MDKILVLDFGGQYNQLIARRVRECRAYSEIRAYHTSIEDIQSSGYKGIILTGGPKSVYADGAPACDPRLFGLGIPVLGICYGAQLMAYAMSGEVTACDSSEYGPATLTVSSGSGLLAGVSDESVCYMSHTDHINRLPEGFTITAHTPGCPVAAMENSDKNLYAVQFHPEVSHTQHGQRIMENFVNGICRAQGDWNIPEFVDNTIAAIREQVGSARVLCALSGGVDSSVSALMTHRAVGNQLTCIFVDHGLMRKDEGDWVMDIYRDMGMNVIRCNRGDRFVEKLAGITDPERKRKIIGEEFIRVFEEEARKLGQVDFLVQGTIYPDIIESGVGDAVVIKSHHNVGGLPDVIDFKGIIEPLKELFKDEVRQAGRALGLPAALTERQPFPGPGLGVRVIGEVTHDKLDILREADAIFRQELDDAGLGRDIQLYFAILTGMRSVGVMGDRRTYDYTIALRAMNTPDFMTADWTRIPYEVLARVSSRIVNEVPHVNRVVYDITTKPPATMEWE